MAWATTTGTDVAVALGLVVPSLSAYAVLCAGVKVKSAKASRATRSEVELEPTPCASWRILARAFYVGPLSAIAAFSCGSALALKAPWPEADRLIAGSMFTPVLWAAAMIWATTDSRLARIGVGLTFGSVVSFAAAIA